MAEAIEIFSKSTRQFANGLYSKVCESKPKENLIFSPFSIQTCIALAFAGAGGKTAEEISKGLYLLSNDRKVVGTSFKTILDAYVNNPSLKIANKFYVKTGYTVKDEFNQIATQSFHSEAENVNFEEKSKTAQLINHWVENHTNGKIKDLISENVLDDDTRMVLVNAIHFKGDWLKKFDKSKTIAEDFWISESKSIKVDMMNIQNKYKYGSFKNLDAAAINMPYANNFSMFVLLPNSKTGLKDLEGKLKNIDLTELQQEMYSSSVIVKFPKFKVELELDLKETLENMNMGNMFSNEADFSNMLTSDEDLKVSKVIHKAFIEVNEEGAEAAAATGMVMMMRCSAPMHTNPPPKFIADRPFLFYIKDDNNNIFFVGKYLK